MELPMQFKRDLLSLFTLAICLGSGAALAAGGGAAKSDPGAMSGKHFHPKGKMPSKFTVELQNQLRKSLPFEDKRDFEEQTRPAM
jgi:hypothetical protein